MRSYKLLKNKIQKAKHILISTHIHPDADGIGSQVALCLALKQLGKEAICVNEAKLLTRYKYLDKQDVITSYREYTKQFPDKVIDLLIVVDTNNTEMIGENMKKLLKKSKELLFIDHHPCPAYLEAIHCIETSMSATGELVGSLIKKLGIPFTKEMALPLYTSILIDTSSFRYPTVTGNTHRIVADLLETGITAHDAYTKIYGAKKVSHMQLLGHILSSAKTSKSEEIAWIIVTDDLIQRYGSDVEDTHGFVNHLLILDNLKVSLMFRDIGTQVKISFRSNGKIDVGAIAQALGGGGHNHSAATIVEGKLQTVVRETVSKVEKMLELDRRKLT